MYLSYHSSTDAKGEKEKESLMWDRRGSFLFIHKITEPDSENQYDCGIVTFPYFENGAVSCCIVLGRSNYFPPSLRYRLLLASERRILRLPIWGEPRPDGEKGKIRKDT